MPGTYCIRGDYQANASVPTVEQAFGDYWDEARIGKSMDFQWDVYARAAAVAAEHGLNTVADFGCGVGTKLDHFLGHLHPVRFDQPTVAEHVRARFPRICFRGIDLERSAAVGGGFGAV
jgi:hypothetical protein